MSIWTPENVETLKKLWAGGATGSQIALIMGNGLTRCSVLGKLHRMANYKLPHYARPPGRHKNPDKPGRPPGVPNAKPGPKPSPKPTLPVLEHRLAVAISIKTERKVSSSGTRPLGVPAILLERDPLGCAWPTDRDRRTNLWLHCNQHRVEGGDYCPDHLGLMYGR